MIPCPHIVQQGSVNYACQFEKGHAGPHSITEPAQNIVATVVLPVNMGGQTFYLWRDGAVTWKNTRSN